MELLETQDPEKRRLIETSDRHKRELEKDIKSVSDKTEQLTKNALIIGGVLAVTYLLVSQLSGTKKKKKKIKIKTGTPTETNEELEEEPATPSVFSQIGSKVADTATVVLLDLAKDALAEYLKNRKQKDGDS
jgi:hypothetical protein